MSAPGLQAVQTVGGLIPPGLLARIQAGELKDGAGLNPATYHLAGRETVRDAASRAWSYLRGAWTAWREHAAAQPAKTPGTAAARERWLLVLLRELGYGQVPALSGGRVIDGRDYPISHAWQHIPIHLLGPGVDLDRRNPGVAGAARAPQSMVQELLNRSDEHLWAILSNGLRLRLLRDSTSLAGSAYLEFDLQAIFDGELYPEFLLMFQLCHVSRLEQRGGDEGPADCWLEDWRSEAIDAGTRMLDRLRIGVEAALTALGTGFLHHPANRPLIDALRANKLSTKDYHRALLRLVYRLLFCFVAEDRNALLHPDATAAVRDRYARYFSTARLRRLSRIRTGGPHTDLWQTQVVVLHALGGHGDERLGLPALAGLFDPDRRLKDTDGLGDDPLVGCQLANQDLLSAVRHLAWLAVPGQRIQPVDYRNLGAEELGSVYESLLELIPHIDLDERTFQLTSVKGNERRTTGSYYTPPSLVSALLDTALDPLLDEAISHANDSADAQARLLALTVCDPACGSGHFLVAAARRIARRLADLRAGGDEATPAQVQHALREVIGHCIYGVDINDLAAELAKVALWLEALEPGRPLGFLDARIRVGNSLLGTTPALLETGVPDSAFKDVEGDDKAFAAAIRKRNKEEARQAVLFAGHTDTDNTSLAQGRQAVLAVLNEADSVREQAHEMERLEESNAYRTPRLHADAWCAAFVWPLTGDALAVPTNAVLGQLLADQKDPAMKRVTSQVNELANEFRFFHWHIEFPEIFSVSGKKRDQGADGWAGGFSCIIGNPPWDHIEVKEQEFFETVAPEIAEASGNARKKLIDALPNTDPTLAHRFAAEKRHIAGTRLLASDSGLYPLTGRGRIKTDPLFAEGARRLLGPNGRLGLVLPTAIATDATTQHFFRDLVERHSLVALYDFENEEKVFPSVHNQYRFAILTLSTGRSDHVSMAFRARHPSQIASRTYSLQPDEILLLNPNTGTCPVFSSRRDARITIDIYRRVPVLWRDDVPDGNPWDLSFRQGLFNMTTDSASFHRQVELEEAGWVLSGNTYVRDHERMLPLFEAKMIHQFDHRFSTYEGATQEQLNKGTLPRLSESSHADPYMAIMPRYWVAEGLVDAQLAGDPDRGRSAWRHDWLLGWRDISRSVDERTVIGSVIPRAGVGDKFLLALPAQNPAAYIANLSSFALDYVSRQKHSSLKERGRVNPRGWTWL